MELIESLLSSFRSRLKKPFFGNFTIAFVLFNWQGFVFLIFSELKLVNKLSVINSVYWIDSSYWVRPLLVTIGYLLLLPYFYSIVDYITNKALTTRTAIRDNRIVQRMKFELDQALHKKELTDIQTGNKSKSDLLQTIASLEEANSKVDQALKKSLDHNRDVEILLSEQQSINMSLKNDLNSYNSKISELEEKIREINNYSKKLEGTINEIHDENQLLKAQKQEYLNIANEKGNEALALKSEMKLQSDKFDQFQIERQELLEENKVLLFQQNELKQELLHFQSLANKNEDAIELIKKLKAIGLFSTFLNLIKWHKGIQESHYTTNLMLPAKLEAFGLITKLAFDPISFQISPLGEKIWEISITDENL